eukprot:m.353634 g.353634  ORF g.353634 m.353634 type:complete len:363 (+) comp16808_c0_seq1:212-1300(+)
MMMTMPEQHQQQKVATHAPAGTALPPLTFLGGSCNPTTWRKEIAIPMLEQAKVPFFNPQVDDWVPEMIELEANAKRNADWLLFVIDGQTRAIASMVEAATNVAAGRNVAVAVDAVAQGTEFGGSVARNTDLLELNAARSCLVELLAMSGVAVGTLEQAVQQCMKQPQALAPVCNTLNDVACTLFDALDVGAADERDLARCLAERLGTEDCSAATLLAHHAPLLQQVGEYVVSGASTPLLYGYEHTQDEEAQSEGGCERIEPPSAASPCRARLSVLIAALCARAPSVTFAFDPKHRHVADLVQASFAVGAAPATTYIVSEAVPSDAVLEIEGDAEPLSASELKDLNRGRQYLVSMHREIGHGV